MGLIADRRQAAQLFHRWGPVVHLRDADASGIARGLLLRQTDRGELLRIAKSAFVQAPEWESATARERFRRRSIAFGLCIADDAHLTGPAAASFSDCRCSPSRRVCRSPFGREIHTLDTTVRPTAASGTVICRSFTGQPAREC